MSVQWLMPRGEVTLSTRLVSAAFAAGNLHLALELADRRCRSRILPNAADFVVRAEMLHRSGDHASAVADIRTAISDDPDDVFANRKLLVWGTGEERLAAARLLLERDREPASLIASLSALRQGGTTAVARASVIDGEVRGWAAWRPTATGEATDDVHQTVVVEHGDMMERVRLEPEAKHALAPALGAAASFRLRTKVACGQWLNLRSGTGPLSLPPLFTAFVPRPAERRREASVRLHPASPPCPDITVIVPCYGDLAATKRCLDSLVADAAGTPAAVRILAVDDASPEPGMAALLAGLPIDVVSLPSNVGFVGAVNAALPQSVPGDVVLLNADTVLPPGTLERLRSAALASPDIGTATPLSNNGELTSFPTAFRENPMPDAALLRRYAQAAATAPAAVVDIPAGIGFCMYVTRRCLDAVGGLSDTYERGYGEDVHLCLAAREAGFRSVCAANAYVAHEGTRSFGRDKRRLVMRNSARLAARFPKHEREVAAFVAGDPLQPMREAIGYRMIADFRGTLIAAATASRAAAEALARREGRATLLITRDRGVVSLRYADARDAIVAETSFVLPTSAAALSALVAGLAIDRIAAFDPATVGLLGLDDTDVPIDLHFADAAAFGARPAYQRREGPASAAQWRRLAARATTVHADQGDGANLAARVLKLAKGRMTTVGAIARSPGLPDANADRRLGVVLLDESFACHVLLRRIARHLPRGAGEAPALVILGATADDEGLIAHGGIQITGGLGPDELLAAARRYRLTHCLALSSAAHFCSPLLAAASAMPMPLARFHWDEKRPRRAGLDLWLDPSATDEAIAETLAAWLRSSQGDA